MVAVLGRRATRPASVRRLWGCGRRASLPRPRAWQGCPRRAPRPVPEQRRVGQYAVQPAHERGVEVGRRGPRLLLVRSPPRRSASAVDGLDRGGPTARAAAARVEPGRDVARDGVDAARLDVAPCRRWRRSRAPRHTTAVACTTSARPSIASRRSSRRVVPAWLASPGQVDAPPAVRPDVGADGDGAGRVGEVVGLPSGASASALPCSTCSSTNGVDPSRAPRRRGRASRGRDPRRARPRPS